MTKKKERKIHFLYFILCVFFLLVCCYDWISSCTINLLYFLLLVWCLCKGATKIMFGTIAISVQSTTKKYFLENCTWTKEKKTRKNCKFKMNTHYIFSVGDSSIAQFFSWSFILYSLFKSVKIPCDIKFYKNRNSYIHFIPFVTMNCIQCYVQALYMGIQKRERERKKKREIDRWTATIQIVYFLFLFEMENLKKAHFLLKILWSC